MRTFTRTLARTGVLQVDSVNVLQRAHYMPLFSRMGPYDTGMLTRASEQRPRRMVEYWAHVQAFMPVELWPVMRHRMDAWRSQAPEWRVLREKPGLPASLLAEIRELGACTARHLDDGLPKSREHWGWNWSDTREALNYLFLAGELAIAGRNAQFEPLYDLPERVIPAEHLNAPTPSATEAHLELVRRAARSHGVATEQCLRDYFRMKTDATRPAVLSLVDEGELVPATVQGWDRPAYLHRDAARPRQVRARALLSPFDPVVWERERTERIFGFRYRIEIYVPEAKREFGYYVLPFLLGDRIVGRVDLKADRKAGVLVVKAAYTEPDAPDETAAELAAELRDLAAWLCLDDIVVQPRGGLAASLGATITG